MKTMSRTLISIVSIGSFVSLSACMGPADIEEIKEIKSNETAFLIKLEGDTKDGQKMFMSEEFLQQNKVATKRVIIPHRKQSTGRWENDYRWIPTVAVVTVDRSPVTREWTQSEATGTSAKNQAIHCESLESIDFAVGATVSVSIPEEYAARFLYHFAGKSLAEITDNNVRGYVQSILCREFGARNLDLARREKKEIFAVAFKEAKEYFQLRGIALDNLGSSEGMTYTDAAIQNAINETFRTQMDVDRAKQERLAQDERNKLLVAKANAEKEAAVLFGQAREAAVAKTQLEIENVKASAQLEAAKRWDGKLPANIMPQGSSMLFGLDQPQKK